MTLSGEHRRAKSSLTKTAAVDMGRTLRWVRHAREMTLRDVAKECGLSVPYIQNIERGERTGVSEEALVRLAAGYGIDEQIVTDLLFRARIMSSLERYGLSAEEVLFVWNGCHGRLAEVGKQPQTDVEKIVASVAKMGVPAMRGM